MCKGQKNLFVVMKNYFCGTIDSLSLSLKQYIPNKRSRFGIKLFRLCETSEYLWNSFVYLRSKGIITEEVRAMERLLGKSGAVVPKLINDLFGKGYRLFVDNWYASERNQEPS